MIYIIGMSIVLGLLIGSFLNMLTYRLPIMLKRSWQEECQQFLNLAPESTTSTFNFFIPRSHCPQCKHTISWWENIPFFGYLLLRGKCGHCHQRISLRYPIFEVICALFTAIIVWHYGVSWHAAAALIFTWSLLALTVIDLEEQLLPDIITLSLLWLGLLLNMAHLFVPLESAVIGAAVGYVVLWSLATVFRLLTGKVGMGHGDFKLCAALGAWLGWEQLPFLILLASLLGAVVGCIILLTKKLGRDTPIPFGPYLAVAGWVVLLMGHDLLLVFQF